MPITVARVSRRVVWLQLLIGWLPVWALVTALMLAAHPRVEPFQAAAGALRMIAVAAALGLVVQRVVERRPWPARVTPAFVAMHVLAASIYSLSWFALNSLIVSAFLGGVALVIGPGIHAVLVMGIWLYVMIAGVSYTAQATERAARAEATAAQAQLAALRAQVNPHFLFNALHTVVQLIPRSPKEASQAAERLADLLRTAIEEDRDVVTLAEELAFVEKYLEIEKIRFGDRLRVRVDVPADARPGTLPSFAVQTLVENAVRHGAAPRVEPTEVTIVGRLAVGVLTLVVADNGAGATDTQLQNGAGTGLRRLRERLDVLYRGRARLDISSNPSGVAASLVIPQDEDD